MKLVISLSFVLLAALAAILPLPVAAQTESPGSDTILTGTLPLSDAEPMVAPLGDTPAVVFTVNSTIDPGNGPCNAAECTLREAIIAANAKLAADAAQKGAAA